MKVRIALLAFLVPVLGLAACKSDVPDNSSPSSGPIELSEKELAFEAAGGSATVGVKNGGDAWTAKADVSWLTASRVSGKLSVIAAPNKEEDSRAGLITVTGGGSSASLNVTQLGQKKEIKVLTDLPLQPADGADFTIEVLANVPLVPVVPEEVTWIKQLPQTRSMEMVKSSYSFHIDWYGGVDERVGEILFREEGGSLEASAQVRQSSRPDYSGDSKGDVLDDIKVVPTGGEASSFQPGSDIEKSFDGDLETIYHSNWSNEGDDYFPITLDYSFADAKQVDYIVYYPRQSGSNGFFKEVEIWAATEAEPKLTKIMDYDFAGRSTTTRIDLEMPLQSPKIIRFVVKSGAGDGQGFASCAEMEFYERNPDNFDPLTLFTDVTCSELKPGIGEEEINKVSNVLFKNIAYHLLKGTYPDEFRIQDYKAWPDPADWARECTTNKPSLLDNPTGISVQEGQELIVLVGDTHGQQLSIRVQNLDTPGEDGFWASASSYAVVEGVNKIVPKNKGLIYVLYHTPDYASLPPVKIHFATGSVNGYYDSAKHRPEDWSRLLAGAMDKYFDVVGEKAHITFPTEGFRKYASTDGPELIAQYDEMVDILLRFMGVYKYGRTKVNRSYYHAMYKSYMYATDYRTAYNVSGEDVLRLVCDKDQFRQSPWGPAHETGHTLQHHPGFCWAGMTEVTNNIMSNLIDVIFANDSRLMRENRYENGYGIYFPGYSAMEDAADRNPYIRAGRQYDNVFEKAVPYWQLYLYYTRVMGNEDFYPDLYERIRAAQPTIPSNDGEIQLRFTKLASECAGEDLTDFFSRWGFYVPYEGEVDDYGKKQVRLTKELATQYRQSIVGLSLPKPKAPIYYITDNNVELFRSPVAVKAGTYTLVGDKVEITGTTGAVAYEVMSGGVLIAASNNPSLKLRADVDASKMDVFAVGGDGVRMLIPRK